MKIRFSVLRRQSGCEFEIIGLNQVDTQSSVGFQRVSSFLLCPCQIWGLGTVRTSTMMRIKLPKTEGDCHTQNKTTTPKTNFHTQNRITTPKIELPHPNTITAPKIELPHPNTITTPKIELPHPNTITTPKIEFPHPN